MTIPCRYSNHTTPTPLPIDGSTGEGGGQIIRSALTLSMLTGTRIHLTNIRAGRAKSGLMRQHLVCVQASARVCDAQVTGAVLGSGELTFLPQSVRSGDYQFDIGSAGSTGLVLQTLLPALWAVDGTDTSQQTSTLSIKGGTHNPMAPTADFLQFGFLPAMAKLGLLADYQVLQSGFAPIGGGEITANVTPSLNNRYSSHAPYPIQSSTNSLSTCLPLDLTERGAVISIELVASVLNLETNIAIREVESTKARLCLDGIDEAIIHTRTIQLDGIGEGNTCYAIVTVATNSGNHQEIFTVLGSKHLSAAQVGNRLAGMVARYLYKGDAVVDEYLTDQLLLPLALVGGGRFTTRIVSHHSRTQAWVIEQFLPVSIQFDAITDYKTLVSVSI